MGGSTRPLMMALTDAVSAPVGATLASTTSASCSVLVVPAMRRRTARALVKADVTPLVVRVGSAAVPSDVRKVMGRHTRMVVRTAAFIVPASVPCSSMPLLRVKS